MIITTTLLYHAWSSCQGKNGRPPFRKPRKDGAPGHPPSTHSLWTYSHHVPTIRVCLAPKQVTRAGLLAALFTVFGRLKVCLKSGWRR